MLVSFMSAYWASVIIAFFILVAIPAIVWGVYAEEEDSYGAKIARNWTVLLSSLWVLALAFGIWAPVFIPGLY